MQSLDREIVKNQSHSTVPVPGITLSESWRSAFGKLSAGCLSNARAVILIGERGVGKASLVDAWREQSAAAFHVVSLDEATGEPDQVVANLAHQMGVDTADLGRGAILSAITTSVKANKQAGKETVVIVNHADEIPSNTVELLMVLARDRGSDKPLLRYIFSGTKKLRKTLRLDGGAARRQNYVVVEMERFGANQTKAFVLANLSRASDVTISDDAVAYLHESTSGKPANILTVLDKVQTGRMAEGETEITKAHIQSLVKAPRPIEAAPNRPQPKSQVALTDDEESLLNGVVGTVSKSNGTGGQKSFSDPENVIGSSSDLPDSIRNVNDPRPLLRWAFGLDGHSETEALAKRAEASATAASTEGRTQSDSPEALKAALAKVAERERQERNLPPPEPQTSLPTPAPSPTPTPEFVALKPEAENTLEHMIQGEAFAFEPEPVALPREVRSPEELKTVLSDVPPAPAQRGNKAVFAAGLTVIGVAALGVLWTAFQPSEIVNPLDELDAPQQTAALGTPVEPKVVQDVTSSDVVQSVKTPRAAVGDGEPDLAGVIALMKSPDVTASDTGAAASLAPFPDNAPRIVRSGYLAPSGVSSSSENIALRQTIVADMAASERVELAGEEQRLVEQLTALQDQVAQKQEVLASLELSVAAMSSEAKQNGDLRDNRSAEIDAVAKREADYAELTRKVLEAEALLNERREELAAVLAQQGEAKTALAELQGELTTAKSSQADVEADLAQLRSDRDAQLAAAEALNTDVASANERLKAANAKLEEANGTLSERKAALNEIVNRTKAAQVQLDGLVVELESQKSIVTTSNQELSVLSGQREQLKAELATKAAQVEKANGQLEALETSQQTASAEFEALTERKAALQADLESGELALENLTGALNEKQVAVDALVDELSKGANQITSQRAELASLRALEEDVVADQTSAQATVTAEQNQVASVTDEVEGLKAQQVAMAAALSEIETLTASSQRDLDAILRDKSQAEQEIAAAVERLKDIEAQEVAAKKGLASFSGEFEAKQAELATLDGRISTSNKKLEAVASKTKALNTQLAELTTAGTAKLREQQALLDQVTKQLEEKQAALASLAREGGVAQPVIGVRNSDATAALETVTAPAIRVRPAVSSSEPTDTAALTDTTPIVETPQQRSGTGLSPRDSGLVISALSDAPGLGRAPQEKKDELQAALIRGECVTDALKETFGRVNPHTLVALLESMEMCGS